MVIIKKIVYLLLIIIFLFVFLLCSRIYYEKIIIKNINIDDYLNNISDVIINIDECNSKLKVKGNLFIIRIRGWAIRQGEDILTYNCHVLLIDKQNGKIFKIPTELQRRPDVTQYYKADGKNYDNSGFFAKGVLIVRENMHNKKYQVAIQYFNNDNRIIKTTNQLLQIP